MKKHLFRAHTFHWVILCPYYEGLSRLLENPDPQWLRKLGVFCKGDSINLISQGWPEISYARRELVRELLFLAMSFTHNQILGESQ